MNNTLINVWWSVYFPSKLDTLTLGLVLGVSVVSLFQILNLQLVVPSPTWVQPRSASLSLALVSLILVSMWPSFHLATARVATKFFWNVSETFRMHCRGEMWVCSYVGGKQHLNLSLSMPEKKVSHKQFFLDTWNVFKEVFFRRSLLFNCDRVVIDFNIVIFPMILFPIYQSIPKHQALWLAIVIFYY